MTPLLEAFREFARQYSVAQRHVERMGAQGRREQIDEAIEKRQLVEQQVEEHMALVRMPAFLRRRG